MIVIELIFNLAVLVSVSIFSGFIDKRWRKHTINGKIYQGLLFGIVCLIGMMNPFVLSPGLIFDGRSVILSLCGLFFGWESAVIAAAIALVYRLYLGGSGVIMGTSVIVTSTLIGILANRSPDVENRLGKTRYLYMFGLVIHIVMVLCMLTIPSAIRQTAFRTLTVTILVLYPIATALIGKLLKDQADSSRKRETEEALADSERRFTLFMEHLPVYTFLKDHEMRLIYVNKSMADTLGADQWLGKLPQEVFPGEKGEQIYQADLQVRESGMVRIIETFSDKEGREGTFETVKFIIPNEGKGDMLGGISLDITERRKSEQALNRKARELENFNSLMVGRELKMIDLKKEINTLLRESGRESKYIIHEKGNSDSHFQIS
ncbi:MAG TPA: LytS/YhcK type 5TM receptor domain-containing protein [Bacteroidales bacterium]|nr:LytS/YhcK type 5TM receptor domain-containing protein [Bacteroidales bacterium]HPS63155.1 LytS/YhcK type 5TM receptor domain-containing protein [Bacteroidales bacterium]